MDRRRVVAVAGPKGPGSGYVIASRLVLTSAHVVSEEDSVIQLFRPGQPQIYTALVVWRGEPGGRDDAALLRVDDPAWDPPGLPIRWGQLVTDRPGTPCETWGVPEVVQRPERPIDTLHPSGSINPGDRFVGNRYVMNLNQHPPAPPQDGTSPWSGLSGAALFCTDLLTGVIASDPARLAHARLEAVPAYVLLHNPQFRRALAEHGSDTGSTLAPVEWQHLAETTDVLASDSVIPSPSVLLRARHAVVPFHGRTALVNELCAWAALPGLGAFLLHGPAGQGKTRLAQQFADQLANGRWAVLWLRSSHTDNAALEVLAASSVPALVVVDQADARAGQLSMVFEALIRRTPAAPVKLLLLARTADEWWSTLQISNPLFEQFLNQAPVTALTALAPDVATRAQVYQQAVDSFARHLPRVCGWQHHDWTILASRLPAPGPDRPGLDVALTLHATALTDLLDAAMAHSEAEVQRLRIQAHAQTGRGGLRSAPTRRLRTTDLASADPLIAVPAALAIVQSGQVDAAAVIDLAARQQMTSSALRYVLASDPERSAALLLPRIAAANDSWQPAVAATDLFSPAHHPFAVEQLCEMATENAQYDVARMAIQGLGLIGAATTAWDAVECTQRNDDAFGKLSEYTSRALARMFHRPGPESAPVDSQVLDTYGRFITSHHQQEDRLNLPYVYEVFRWLGPAHADPLLQRWLPAAHERLVDLAATALGRIRLDRACRPLAERATQVTNHTSQTICEALGYIATPQAIEMLLARTTGQLSNAAYQALAICLDRTAEEDFVPLAEELLRRDGLEHCRWRVYRAIGLRCVPELLPHLQAGINSPEPFERAVAALALARAEGTTVVPRLLQIQQQTSSPIQELLVLLALLHATRDENLVTDLAIPLGDQGWQLEDALYNDAIQTLREAGGNTGHTLADCTTWIRDAAR